LLSIALSAILQSRSGIAVRILKTTSFSKFARREGLSDRTLQDVEADMEQGSLGDALGSSVYKKRVARPGKGKRGGYRTIYAFKKGQRVFFIEGYAKNEKSNLTGKELKAVRKAASIMLSWTDLELDKVVRQGSLVEVK
jgi:hypothetical protein